jgi:anti-sigma factor RsiW
MSYDSALHSLTDAHLDELLGDAAHARLVRTARNRRTPAHRAPGFLRKLKLRPGRGRPVALASVPRPAEQAR